LILARNRTIVPSQDLPPLPWQKDGKVLVPPAVKTVRQISRANMETDDDSSHNITKHKARIWR